MQLYSQATAGPVQAAVAEVVDEWSGVSQRTTFGCPSFYADGVLFAVVSNQGLSLTRLTDRQRELLERRASVQPFEAGTRRVARWATVDVDAGDLDRVVPALRQSYEAALV